MTEASWYVLTVRPGMELAAAAAVQRKGADVFLPGERRWVRQAARRGGRDAPREVRDFPAWPGFVFVGLHAWSLEPVLRLKLVTGILARERCIDRAQNRWELVPLQLPSRWRRDKAFNGLDDLMAAHSAPPREEARLEKDAPVVIPYAGIARYRAKFVSIDDATGIGKVAMHWFGAERTVSVPAVDIVAAKGDQA